jgi:hypothetical protein
MRKMTGFYTIHRSGSHAAYLTGSAHVLVPSQPTEIDLVRRLNALGIYLKDYEYFNNRQLDDRFSCATDWRRK